MKLRYQLLIINLFSHGIMVVALLISYHQMLLTFKQTQILTAICLLAAILSMLVYWLMTWPIVKSIQDLMLFTKQLAQKNFEKVPIIHEGPKEFKLLGTALHQMGCKLEESFKQLEDGEQARRELIANISHDLRTPIAAIQSMLEALQDNLVEDKATKVRYLATSLKEVHRLNSLINDLFELSKLESKQELFQPQLTYLDSVLLEVLEAHQIYMEEKNIHLQLDIPTILPPLWIMPTKIARVISNLLQNAIYHSPVGGNIELVVRLEKNDLLELILRDEGKGIHPVDRSRIFERFYRTDHSRNKDLGGSGLGLAIVKSLIEIHKGQIGVCDREDKKTGSEFWFTLPLHEITKQSEKARVL